MIFIDIDACEPNEDWLIESEYLTAFLLASTNLEERIDLIKANEELWTRVKQHFCDVLNRKCWYSESVNDFSHCHVDHFRPKLKALNEEGKDQGGYWWLAFDWKNFRFSGPAGNTRKRDFFHVNSNKANQPTDALEDEDVRFLDPTEPGDPEKLKFNNEGIISPKSIAPHSRDFIQAEYTIRRMNLNTEGIIAGRNDTYRRTKRIIRQIEDLLVSQNINYNMARKQAIRAKQIELLKLANKFSPYSAAAKYCLRESGLEWAINIAMAA